MFDKFKNKKNLSEDELQKEKESWEKPVDDLGDWGDLSEAEDAGIEDDYTKSINDSVEEESAREFESFEDSIKKEFTKDKFDRRATTSKKRGFSMNGFGDGGKKGVLIIGLVGVLIVALGISLMLVFGGDSSEKPSNENPDVNTDIVNPEPEEEVPTGEKPIPEIEIVDSSVTELTHYGAVKRIMNNKIIIRPDNSLTDTIFFMDDKTNVNRLNSLNVDDRIEYTYKIEESKNIFVDYKNIYRATVLFIEDNTVTVIDADGKILEYGFSDSLKDVFKQITADDIIEYSIINVNSSNMISSISNIIKPDANVISGRPDFADKGDEFSMEVEVLDPEEWADELKALESESIDPDYLIKMDSDFESNSVKFYNSYENPIWIRFAWRINKYTTSVPSIQEVGVSLVSPKGNIISSETIGDYGRMWIDGNIINFAISEPETGEWTLRADKDIGYYLGETNFMLMELTGFITVNKFGVQNLGDGLLDFVWSIGGVEDSNYEIEISLSSEKFSTKVFSATSKLQDLKLVDHTTFNAKSLPRGTYDIIVKVKDLDIYTEDDSEVLGTEIPEYTRVVGAETIVHEYNAGQLTIN